MAKHEIDINKLSSDERLELIEKLWDSFADESAEMPLTTAQTLEIDHRLDDMDRDDTLGIPWERVLVEIRNGK